MSLITSENHRVCFPSFVLTVFWCSTSYIVIVVLWKMLREPVNALARVWPCACLKCVSGLRRLERNLSFLRCIHVFDLVLKYVSDINEGNRLQLLFYVIVLIGVVDSVSEMSFFQLCFRFSIEVFSYCTLTETFALGFQKLFDHEWIDFGVFCWERASFVDFTSVWTEICKTFSIDVLFWRHQNFSMFSLRGFLVCSLKMLVLFSHMILWYRLKSLRKAMQLYLLSLFVFEPIFLGSSGKCLWLLLKTIESVFRVLC